jgi:hypothetical protein
LQALPDVGSDNPFSNSVGETAGFSSPQGALSPGARAHLVHAGVATKDNERAKFSFQYLSKQNFMVIWLKNNGSVMVLDFQQALADRRY